MKTGLVLEGGAMRGMYTAGVIDVLLENDINVDGVVGVSAGAVFGCNYKSKQIGRAIRYNTRFCKDKRYMSINSLIKTGDLYNVKFCYEELPNKLDIFDVETYASNPVEFHVVCTDIQEGKPVYHRCDEGGAKDLEWFRASASMPIVSRVVSIGEHKLLDGGMVDPIPVAYARKAGFKKNIVVLTRPEGYFKKKASGLMLYRLLLRKYPKVLDVMSRRHEVYNDTLKYIDKLVEEGDTLVVRPSRLVDISRTETDENKLREMYELGRNDANNSLEAIKHFLES